MKLISILAIAIFLVGCNQEVVQKGEAYYVYYRLGPAKTNLLVGEDYKDDAGVEANSQFKYRNPYIILYTNYALITYPGTDTHDITIPREAIFQIAWKEKQK